MEPDRSEVHPLRVFLNVGLEFLFPAICLICKVRLGLGNRGPVCAACWEEVSPIRQPCRRCGHPLDYETGTLDDDERDASAYCNLCQKSSPLFAQARSIFYYEGTIRQLIHCFKYQGMLRVGKFLASSVSEYVQTNPLTADCVVPVPIGIKKLRHREFNQSLVLAREAGKKLKVPVYPFALKREREVAAQMRLSRQERMRNIRGAFGVREASHIHNKKVLLVDDVLTTGATASECTRILLKHGASQVRVLTLARTVLSSRGQL